MRPVESRELLPNGSVINERYEVISTLGFGGMGTVIKVKDIALDGEIGALKILFPHLASDQIQFARFRNEVLLARRLSHPNIVRIYDFGSWKQYYFLSMEYVEGGTLTDRIYGRGHNKLHFDDAIQYLLQIADALACAHKSGVVHRDMKPDNIMITTNHTVKVADFGLARAMDIDKRFTSTGETVGTPYYMSPEQLAGEKPDQRVDIYSMGIMAYEMVVGRRPFASDSYLELAHMHMTQALPDMCQINPSTPKWYKEFVETCCEKHREDRFTSSEEATRFLLERADEKIKKKVYRVPAVLSIGVLPSVKGKKLYRGLKKSGLCIISLWTMFLILHMLPLGPLTYARLRANTGALEKFYPFLTFDKTEDFQKYLDQKDWYRIKELLVLTPSLIEESQESIVKAFVSEDLPRIQDILEYQQNKEFLLELILESNKYEVVRFSVEKLVNGSRYKAPVEKEDSLVVKLMSFDEPNLIDKYFSPTKEALSLWMSKENESLLVFAYKAKAWNVFKFLLGRGVSPEGRLKSGVSLVGQAKEEMPDIYKLLVQYGADPSSLSVHSKGKASYSIK